MKINTKLIHRDLHINVLDTVLAILTYNMREWKALLETIDEHGLFLLTCQCAEFFHFHTIDCYKKADDGGACNDDGLIQQSVEGPRFDRCQSDSRGMRTASVNWVGSKQTPWHTWLRVTCPIERDDGSAMTRAGDPITPPTNSHAWNVPLSRECPGV